MNLPSFMLKEKCMMLCVLFHATNAYKLYKFMEIIIFFNLNMN